jgi:hypothetical protein
MPREISDEEFNFLQNRRQVADVADMLWNDPLLGPEAKALLKKKMPELVIPEHDIRNEIRQEFAVRDQKANEERENERIAKEDAYWRGQRKKTMDEYGMPEEKMKEMEKWMYENNVGSYEVAATYHAAKNPKPSQPAGYKDPYWNHTKSDLFQQIAKDPEEWGRSEIIKALNGQQEQNLWSPNGQHRRQF